MTKSKGTPDDAISLRGGTGEKKLSYRDFRRERNNTEKSLIRETFGSKPTSEQKTAAKIVTRKILMEKYGDQAVKRIKQEDIIRGVAFASMLASISVATLAFEIKTGTY